MAVTTVGFDIAALELFLPLRQWCRVLPIIPTETVKDTPALARAIEKTGPRFCRARRHSGKRS